MAGCNVTPLTTSGNQQFGGHTDCAPNHNHGYEVEPNVHVPRDDEQDNPRTWDLYHLPSDQYMVVVTIFESNLDEPSCKMRYAHPDELNKYVNLWTKDEMGKEKYVKEILLPSFGIHI